METAGEKKQIASIDLVKFIACFFVVTIHAAPFPELPAADLFLRSVAARIFLMFFFVAAGYLFFRRLGQMGADGEKAAFRGYLVRIFRLFALWTAVYFPFFLLLKRGELSGFGPSTLWDWLREIVFVGDFYHLWFLGALLVGTALVYGLYRAGLSPAASAAVAGGLYLLGLLGHSYGFLLDGVPALAQLRDSYLAFFFTTRNGVFAAPVFLALGRWIAEAGRIPPEKAAAAGLAGAGALLTAEVFWLSGRTEQMELFFMLPAASALLLCLALRLPVRGGGPWRTLRSYSTLVFLIHPIMILGHSVLRGLLGLPESYLLRYAFVAASSLAAAAAVVRLQRTKTFAWLKYFY